MQRILSFSRPLANISSANNGFSYLQSRGPTISNRMTLTTPLSLNKTDLTSNLQQIRTWHSTPEKSDRRTKRKEKKRAGNKEEVNDKDLALAYKLADSGLSEEKTDDKLAKEIEELFAFEIEADSKRKIDVEEEEAWEREAQIYERQFDETAAAREEEFGDDEKQVMETEEGEEIEQDTEDYEPPYERDPDLEGFDEERNTYRLKELDSFAETAPHYKDISKQIVMTELIKIGSHQKTTAGGRILSFSALIVGGTSTGTAGIGYGKAKTTAKAVENAAIDLRKNLVSVYRFEDRTIPRDIQVKYRSTNLLIRSNSPGSGLRGHPTLVLFAKCFGFKDLTMKVYGSTNPHQLLRAMIKAFEMVESPAELARRLGKKYFNKDRIYNVANGESPFVTATRAKTTPEMIRREMEGEGKHVIAGDE